ncbi:MAG TPA: hypothetical protein PKM27_13605 [Saprospiraceae bacterium]|nr:hypothetical protein [Saprospiraceae bacterium]HNT21701.1 hypothetical protein [Saprospiraceae bacterium]
MYIVTRIHFFLLACLVLAVSCKSRYERMLERELASGERHDSLFLGLTLGMDRKTFFEICWNYNKKGEMTQGSNNLSARYFLNEGLKAPAYLDFYPTFSNDSIVEMPALFTYKDWAPWIKAYSTDSLLVDVKQLLERWYGPGFIEIKNKQKGNLWVKVDGNRRIRFFKREPREVRMIITDMSKTPQTVNGAGNE